MLNGLVIGTATTTLRHPSMRGWRLLVVQAFAADGRTPDGEPILVVDSLGAGVGQWVMISSDGQGTRELLASPTSPVRWSVIGLPDPTGPGPQEDLRLPKGNKATS